MAPEDDRNHLCAFPERPEELLSDVLLTQRVLEGQIEAVPGGQNIHAVTHVRFWTFMGTAIPEDVDVNVLSEFLYVLLSLASILVRRVAFTHEPSD